MAKLISGIFSGLLCARNSEHNKQNTTEILDLCGELGVPEKAFYQIVVNQMDRAKDIALKLSQPGEPHHASPLNTRLAIAIARIYHSNAR